MTAQDKNETHVTPSTTPIADYLAAHRARMNAGPKLNKLKN